jgi:hypothetical protein
MGLRGDIFLDLTTVFVLSIFNLLHFEEILQVFVGFGGGNSVGRYHGSWG